MRSRRGWNAAVTASVALLAAFALALGIEWLVTNDSRTTTYSATGPLTSVELDLSSGDADIVGGSGSDVRVQRTDRSSFGHSALEQRTFANGLLKLSSACPRIIVGSCSSSYRVSVPEDVAVTVRTGAGHVHLGSFHGSASITTGSGSVTVDAFCGFALSAMSRAGDIRIITACAPKTLDVSSDTGNLSTLLPPGRYRIQASSDSGTRRVSGVVPTATAPFSISAHSRRGNVTVEGGV